MEGKDGMRLLGFIVYDNDVRKNAFVNAITTGVVGGSSWDNKAGLSVVSNYGDTGYLITAVPFDKELIPGVPGKTISYFRELLFNYIYSGPSRNTNHYINVYCYYKTGYFVRFGLRFAGATTTSTPDQISLSWYSPDGMTYLYLDVANWNVPSSGKYNAIKLGLEVAFSHSGYYCYRPFCTLNGVSFDLSTLIPKTLAIADFLNLNMTVLMEEVTGSPSILVIGGFE